MERVERSVAPPMSQSVCFLVPTTMPTQAAPGTVLVPVAPAPAPAPAPNNGGLPPSVPRRDKSLSALSHELITRYGQDGATTTFHLDFDKRDVWSFSSAPGSEPQQYGARGKALGYLTRARFVWYLRAHA